MTRSRTLNHDGRLSLQRLFDSPAKQTGSSHVPQSDATTLPSSPMKTIERKPMVKRGSVREKLSPYVSAVADVTGDDLRRTMMKRTSMTKSKSQREKKKLDEDEDEEGTPAKGRASRRNSETGKANASESPNRKRKQDDGQDAMLVGEDSDKDRRLKKLKT